MDLGALSDIVAALHELRNEAESQGQAPITNLCDALITRIRASRRSSAERSRSRGAAHRARDAARNVRCDRGGTDDCPMPSKEIRALADVRVAEVRRRRTRSRRTGRSRAAIGEGRRLPDVRPTAAARAADSNRLRRLCVDRRSRSQQEPVEQKPPNGSCSRSKSAPVEVPEPKVPLLEERVEAPVSRSRAVALPRSRCRPTPITKFSRSSSKKPTSCSRRSIRASTSGSRCPTTAFTSRICCVRCTR